MYISQTKHNHIATPMEGTNRLSKSNFKANTKKKRQMPWISAKRRKKRNHSNSYYDTDDDSDESEHIEDSNEYDTHFSHNRDRLEDINDQPFPFWDTYDTLNQYYLEIGECNMQLTVPILLILFEFYLGNKFDMKNHYRGHKLSLWLNLIPQLHNPGELSELSIRHHHFSESDAKFYDGIVRVQKIEKPVFIKPVILKNDAAITPRKFLVTTVPSITGMYLRK